MSPWLAAFIGVCTALPVGIIIGLAVASLDDEVQAESDRALAFRLHNEQAKSMKETL